MSQIGLYVYVPDADARADLIRFLSDVEGLQISDMYWGVLYPLLSLLGYSSG